MNMPKRNTILITSTRVLSKYIAERMNVLNTMRVTPVSEAEISSTLSINTLTKNSKNPANKTILIQPTI